jgi:hypothetical protein
MKNCPGSEAGQFIMVRHYIYVIEQFFISTEFRVLELLKTGLISGLIKDYWIVAILRQRKE